MTERLSYESGGSYTYSCKNKKHYCVEGEKFIANTSIVAGVLPYKEKLECNESTYNFISDVKNNKHEIRYAGVKALGFLPRTEEGVQCLYEIIIGNC